MSYANIYGRSKKFEKYWPT